VSQDVLPVVSQDVLPVVSQNVLPVVSQNVLVPVVATFVDVPVTHVLFERIEWLVERKVTTGYGGVNGIEYRPNYSVTRGEMAMFLYRLAGSPTFTPSLVSPFVDVPVTADYYTAVSWLVSEKITTGYQNVNGTQYRPNGSVTRGEIATFLYRFAGSPTFTPPLVSPFVDVPVTAGYYTAVSWLASESISTGYRSVNGAQYRPANSVTRGEMATFLWRIAVDYQSVNADGTPNTVTTTKLILTFNKNTTLTNLTTADITLTSSNTADITKETLTKVTPGVYNLIISGTWIDDTVVNVHLTTSRHNITPHTRTVTLHTAPIPLTYTSATVDTNSASGVSATSSIVLTFDKNITGLSIGDITLSDTSIVKELLTKRDNTTGVYDLNITGSWTNNAAITVTVTKPGYTLTPTNKTVTLHTNTSNKIVLAATTTSTDQTVTINKYFANDYAVNWGDNTNTETVTAAMQHTYTTAGTHTITLTTTNTSSPYWTFSSSNTPLVPKSGTTASNIQITEMPPLSDFIGASNQNGNYTAGDNFFRSFNYMGALASVPVGSFDTSGITVTGSYFFTNFNSGGALASLPVGSFDTSGITTASDHFFTYFNCNGSLSSLPVGSFSTSNIITTGDYFFTFFNYMGALASLPVGSFDTSGITTAGIYFFSNFNCNGALASLPVGSFGISKLPPSATTSSPASTIRVLWLVCLLVHLTPAKLPPSATTSSPTSTIRVL
jgi:hypothetical protein